MPDAGRSSLYQVVVVGAGPTGLTVANLLGRYGIRTLLVERNATTVQEPRAVSIDDESLRTMQACGAIDTVRKDIVAGYGSEYMTPSGKVFLRVLPTAMPYGFPRRNAFRQPLFEAQLRDHLSHWPTVETMFGWRVETLGQDETGVTLSLADGDGQQRRVRADYVVAADGASSRIREKLGLKLDGETFSEKWLIVDLEASDAPSRETMVFCDVRRPCIALPGPNGTRRFEFKLVPSDDITRMTDDDVVAGLLEAHGADPASTVRRRTVYTFHARLASRWAKGRVFLAGDACHLTPPFAGQGMNSGIRDAHNIAWKLAWVAAGRAAPSILDSYERERRPHVGEMIQLALRMGRIMAPRSRLAGWLTQTSFRLLGIVPHTRDYFAQMKYKPKPRFAEGLLVGDGRPARRTSVGRLLPQPQVEQDGAMVPLDSVLGDGFSLLGFTDAASLARLAAHPVVARLDARCILVGQRAGPDLDTVVHDASGALRAGLDMADGRIFLIRPDRYVLAAFTPDQAGTTLDRLHALLGPVTEVPAAEPALCTA